MSIHDCFDAARRLARRQSPPAIFRDYLTREVGRTMAVMLTVLVTLFASYSAGNLLNDAVNGLMPADTIAALVGLKALISLEVLIPVSLYISIVLAFGKLYSDSEFTAMFALGMTPTKVIRIVLTLAGSLALIVAFLSLVVRPWAYQLSHELTARAETMLSVDYMEAGTFYVGDKGNRVIFVEHRSGPKSPAKNIFVRTMHQGHPRIIYAEKANQKALEAGQDSADVLLNNAHVYDFVPQGHPDDSAMTVEEVTVPTGNRSIRAPEYASTAAGTFSLARSSQPQDIAELQWRLSTPISTLLLGLLGVPLSRAKPRQSRYSKIGTAILLYSGYYLLCTSARTWVQHGTVGSFPGIWWVPALLAVLVALASYSDLLKMSLRRFLKLAPARLPDLLPGSYAEDYESARPLYRAGSA
ncbi:MAG TPA: LPS export ABC transporter permease LptF [Alphaproteobacteria bacterium]|nr:LPS export ABC transporter permease LptF [Alphaproteobacteria bacterium]